MSTAEPGVVYGLEVGERDPLLLVVFCEKESDELFRYAAWLLQSALYKNGFKRDCIEYTDEENIWRPSNEHEVANELTTRRIFRSHSHCQVARIMDGPFSGMPAVGVGSTLKKRERACKFAMAVAVASRGRDWDQWQVQNKIKMRRDPLGMKMLTNDGHRSAVQEDRLLIHQAHLMQARQAWLQLVASKRTSC